MAIDKLPEEGLTAGDIALQKAQVHAIDEIGDYPSPDKRKVKSKLALMPDATAATVASPQAPAYTLGVIGQEKPSEKNARKENKKELKKAKKAFDEGAKCLFTYRGKIIARMPDKTTRTIGDEEQTLIDLLKADGYAWREDVTQSSPEAAGRAGGDEGEDGEDDGTREPKSRAITEAHAEKIALMKINPDQPLMSGYITRAAWWNEAMMDIGVAAYHTLAQIQKVIPAEAVAQASQLGKKEEFVKYFSDALRILMRGVESAEAIQSLEDDVKLARLETFVANNALGDLKRQYQMLHHLHLLAISSMCRNDSQMFMRKQLAAMNAPIAFDAGDEVSDDNGGGDGQMNPSSLPSPRMDGE